MKKFVIAGLIILVISTVAAIIAGANGKNVHLASVISMYADSNGVYFIEVDERQYYYYKLDTSGNVLTKVKLPQKNGDYFCTYNEIVADEDGNVYISAYEKDNLQNIYSRYVQVLNNKGQNVEKLFETDNGSILANSETSQFERIELMKGLQFTNNKVSIFVLANEHNLSLFEYDCESGTEIETEYIFDTPVNIKEAYNIKNGNIYYTTDIGELFYVTSLKENQKVNLEYDGKENVVPYGLSLDGANNLYFTDVHNFTLVKYRGWEEKADIVYNKTDYIGADKRFEDLRYVRYYNNGLYAHSPIHEDESSFLMGIGAEQFVIEYKIYSGKLLFLYTVNIFFKIFALLLSVSVLAYSIIRLRSLLVKQVILFALLMSVPALFISKELINLLEYEFRNRLSGGLHLLSTGIARNIDGYEFRNQIFPENSEYLKSIDSDISIWFKDFEKLFNDEVSQNLYYILFFIEDNKIYIGYGSDEISGMRDEYISKHSEDFFEKNPGYETKDITVHDRYGTWVLSRAFIFEGDEPVGLLEIGTMQDMIDDTIVQARRHNMLVSLLILACAISLLTLMLWRLLKGIGILKEGLSQMTDGNWHVRINIKSGDEIEDIANDFNKMSSRIEKYVNSITKLNSAYEKFVPNELFEILGKKNIFEIKLGDQSNKNINLMSASIKDFYTISKSMTTEECFEMINKVFGTSSQVIRSKGGVIENFSGSGLRALFTNETDYAIDAALRIIEKINVYNKENNKNIQLNIIVQNGDSMVGIAGDYNRMVETVISRAVNNIFILEKLTEAYNINLLVAEKAFDKIERKEKYNYCCIGKVNDEVENSTVRIYDFLDSYEILKRNKRIIIKEDFEKGLAFYTDGKFQEARKKFADVLRIDNTYEVAKLYLFMCDSTKSKDNDREEAILL